MSKEKDFFKTCFNTVAGLEVKNESQAIAKEVVLNEIENLEQENKRLQERIDKAREFINENKDKYYQDWGQDDCSVDIYLGEYEIKELLDILNEVSE